MTTSGALVIFVKTPGCSPIKTRLAKSIGESLAEEFYARCLTATAAYVRDVQKKLPGLKIYWAVAETEGLSSPLWSEFSVISQGEGNLGDRLSNVYQEILKRHGFACFVGADSPHARSELIVQGILETIRYLNEKFVMGETCDGGFYFFGGSIPVSEALWKSVEYSTSHTANDLREQLRSLGSVVNIETDFDIDTVEDMKHYREDRFDSSDLLPEQTNLIKWARALLSDRLDGAIP